MKELVLPSFAMDCRDWLVGSPGDAEIPGDVDGAPVLAVLHTVVIGRDSFHAAKGVITVGFYDGAAEVADTRALAGSPAAELLDTDDDCLRFVLPAPHGPLALLAEFTLPDGLNPAVVDRVELLMSSFRWAA